MTKKISPRASLRLWGALRVWAWIFMAGSSLMLAAYAYRVVILSRLPADTPMDQTSVLADYVPGAEAELWLGLAGSLVYLTGLVVGALLTLKWYLRSVRNAHALFNGIETSPRWAVWWFIIPVVSLFKPYGMTSELWRSSQSPDAWRGLRDPVLLRWWWGVVLVAGFALTFSNILSRSAATASQLQIADAAFLPGCALQIVAGLLFLRVGGPISERQTALIEAGRVKPASTTPSWSA